DPAMDQYLLETLAEKYANVDVRAADAPPAGQLDLDGSASDAGDEASRRAAAVARLVDPLEQALEARGLRALYDDVERPLVRVLARMEQVGVRVDDVYLKGLVADLTDEVRVLD